VAQPALLASSISKRFGPTRALEAVDFHVMGGEIHALVGENGAGKSTLIRILSGVLTADQGAIYVDGEAQRFLGPRDAIGVGIATIPQELRLVGALSVAENIALGDLPVRRLFGCVRVLDRVRMRVEALSTLRILEFAPDPDRPVRQLTFAERQLVAIGKALRRNCRVLILDEPTAALEKREIERLFAVLERMRRQGVAIVYISHRLEEIVTLADRCTILRDGRVSAVSRRGEFNVAALVQSMSGRIADEIRPFTSTLGETLLEETRRPEDGMRLRAGEVVGLAGLLGSGKGRLLRRLFGIESEPAHVLVRGVSRRLSAPWRAVAAGIGMVPGERGHGLVMSQSVRDNILLASLDRLKSWHGLDRRAGERTVNALMDSLDIRPRRSELRVSLLSGGNQQKVVLAKWLARNVEILLLDEATQGIDVAAKAQIHALLRAFAEQGGSVLISSSDLGELARLCDTLVALHRGRIRARMVRSRFSEQELLRAIGA